MAFCVSFELWHWSSIDPSSTPGLGACGDRAVNALPPALATGREDDINLKGVSIAGKYFLGWILGVPVVVLVIIYLIFN